MPGIPKFQIFSVSGTGTRYLIPVRYLHTACGVTGYIDWTQSAAAAKAMKKAGDLVHEAFLLRKREEKRRKADMVRTALNRKKQRREDLAEEEEEEDSEKEDDKMETNKGNSIIIEEMEVNLHEDVKKEEEIEGDVKEEVADFLNSKKGGKIKSENPVDKQHMVATVGDEVKTDVVVKNHGVILTDMVEKVTNDSKSIFPGTKAGDDSNFVEANGSSS
jgi:hypothetical protein